MQPSGLNRFSLQMWRANCVSDQKSDISTAANSILARVDEVAIRAADQENQFNPVAEFATQFRNEMPAELQPLGKIDPEIDIIPESSCILIYGPFGDRLNAYITDKICREEISTMVYRAEDDTNAVVMFPQPKRDRLTEPRFQLDCRPQNAFTIRKQTPRPDIQQAIEFLVASPLWTKMDLSDRYHNIPIDTESEVHITILCHTGSYRSRVMEQGASNAPTTMVRAMNEIFRDIIYMPLIIYIDDIIISSRNYKQYIEAS